MSVYTFEPSNTLTFETVQANHRRLSKLLATREVAGICINLLAVKHCDSTGLALLIEAKRLCEQRNLTFSLDNMSDSLSGLAKFCGVDTVLL